MIHKLCLILCDTSACVCALAICASACKQSFDLIVLRQLINVI